MLCTLLTLLVLSTGCQSESISGNDLMESPETEASFSALGKTGAPSTQALRNLLNNVSPTGSADYFMLPASNQYNRIPQDPQNPLSAQKVRLGQLLYHETAMGVNSTTGNPETFSCASCHFAQAGFQAGLAQGVADGGSGFANRVNVHGTASDIQPIRTPSSMNTAYQKLMLWNGQFGGPGNESSLEVGLPQDIRDLNASGLEGLEVQAIKGLEVHRMKDGAAEVVDLRKYDNLFRQVFGDSDESANRHNAGLAIAAFERTLLANQSPFQRWLKGNPNAMTGQELQGALVFFGEKANCVACHTGPALNSESFHALGMNDLDVGAPDLIPPGFSVPDGTRKGRGGVTGQSDEEFKFKTPQLYNLADSPFYGHGASFRTIREVVEYKNSGVAENPGASNISSLFAPLGLTPEEVDALIAFLESGLHDPDLMRYQPAFLPSGNCTPTNDPDSQADLGCTSD